MFVKDWFCSINLSDQYMISSAILQSLIGLHLRFTDLGIILLRWLCLILTVIIHDQSDLYSYWPNYMEEWLKAFFSFLHYTISFMYFLYLQVAYQQLFSTEKWHFIPQTEKQWITNSAI